MESGIWFDIDLETIEPYAIWKPDSLAWALTIDWATVNSLIRDNLHAFPVDNLQVAWQSALASSRLTDADREGLASLYAEPIHATSLQVTSGGHRITAMRAQGIRWALGQCYLEDIGDSVDPLHAYIR